jgi:hypothetical protein
VISRLRLLTGLPLPLRVVFEMPSVAKLACYLDSQHKNQNAFERIESALRHVTALSEEELDEILAEKQG